MTFEQMLKLRDETDRAVAAAGQKLDTFPRGPAGLTADNIKASPEWREARAVFDASFAKLRKINGFLIKNYPQQMRQNRKLSRA